MKCLFFIFIPFFASAQNFYEGIVVNKTTKEPVPYASVSLIKGRVGINADQNGYFKLENSNIELNDSLMISCMGFLPIKIQVGALTNSSTKIQLSEAIFNLKEVVVSNNNFKNNITLNDFEKAIGPYYGSGNFIGQLAQHFVSPSENAMLKNIKIARFGIPLLLPQKCLFRIRVYDVDPVSGRPANDLTDQIIEVNSKNKSVELDLEKYKIYIPNKDFFIAIEWLRIPYNANEAKINGKSNIYYAPSIGWAKNSTNKMDIWELGLNNVWGKLPQQLYANQNLAIAVSLLY